MKGESRVTEEEMRKQLEEQRNELEAAAIILTVSLLGIVSIVIAGVLCGGMGGNQ